LVVDEELSEVEAHLNELRAGLIKGSVSRTNNILAKTHRKEISTPAATHAAQFELSADLLEYLNSSRI
jgi:hypothetical protein